MKRELKVAIWSIACAFSAQAFAGEYYLYAPTQTESGKLPAGPDEGVLVKAVTIRRGDTLKSISRKYSGRGSFFPQILLFNQIKNPDLIYAGNTLRVPVTKEEAVEKTAPRRKGKRRVGKPHAQAKVKEAKPLPAKRSEGEGRPLFEKAVKAYRAGAYRRALEAFDRFLATYPNSPLAPDATLFRADCYMKLAGE